MDVSGAKLKIYRKIDREKAILHAADHMRHATNNASVNAQVESQIRDARQKYRAFRTNIARAPDTKDKRMPKRPGKTRQ